MYKWQSNIIYLKYFQIHKMNFNTLNENYHNDRVCEKQY